MLTILWSEYHNFEDSSEDMMQYNIVLQTVIIQYRSVLTQSALHTVILHQPLQPLIDHRPSCIPDIFILTLGKFCVTPWSNGASANACSEQWQKYPRNPWSADGLSACDVTSHIYYRKLVMDGRFGRKILHLHHSCGRDTPTPWLAADLLPVGMSC
jgi:hypothetical protein